jgi:hypothetical protein
MRFPVSAFFVVLFISQQIAAGLSTHRLFTLLVSPTTNVHEDDPSSVEHDELVRLIENAGCLDDVFSIAEDIPAIRRSVDKFIRVSFANEDDAHLAAAAVYRLANLTATARLSPAMASTVVSVVEDRRYQQLVECIELRIKNLKIADIARYLWAVTIIGITEDRANVVLNEFSRRLLDGDEESGDGPVSLEEAATICWVVGCLKDSHGWTNMQLISLLRDRLSSRISRSNDNNRIVGSKGSSSSASSSTSNSTNITGGDRKRSFAGLPLKLVIRVLWSLGIHGINDDDLTIEALTAVVDEGNLEKVPVSSAVTLFWAVSQSRVLIKLDSTLRLLHYVSSTETTSVSIAEMSLLADALVALRDTATSQQSRGQRVAPSDEEKIQALTETLEESMIMLVENFVTRCSQSSFDALLPIPILISVLRVAVSAQGQSRPQVWTLALSQLHKAFASQVSFSTSEAASLLEIIAFIPRTYGSSGASSNSGSKNPLLSDGATQNPNWHRISGRLAAICASNAAQLKDKTHLINACWALSTLGYPYRKILRATRKQVQFALHELSANLLARLVVAVAAEEVFYTYSSPGNRRVAKFDREFVEDVALSVYRTASEVYPLHSKINALVAVAGLGRITSFEFEIRSGHQPVSISREEFATLSTGLLIQLLWATLRLPDGLMSADTMDALEAELRKRNLSPPPLEFEQQSPTATASSSLPEAHNGGGMGGGGGGGGGSPDSVAVGRGIYEASLEDLKLYLRTFAEAKGTGDSKLFKKQDDFLESLTKPILAHIRARAVATSTESVVTQLVVRQAQSIASEVISLCEIVQSFIDLSLHETQAEALFQEQYQIQSRKYNELAASPLAAGELCTCAYQLGRLEELLKIYSTVPQKSTGSDSRFDAGKKILSRLLGMR